MLEIHYRQEASVEKSMWLQCVPHQKCEICFSFCCCCPTWVFSVVFLFVQLMFPCRWRVINIQQWFSPDQSQIISLQTKWNIIFNDSKAKCQPVRNISGPGLRNVFVFDSDFSGLQDYRKSHSESGPCSVFDWLWSELAIPDATVPPGWPTMFWWYHSALRVFPCQGMEKSHLPAAWQSGGQVSKRSCCSEECAALICSLEVHTQTSKLLSIEKINPAQCWHQTRSSYTTFAISY